MKRFEAVGFFGAWLACATAIGQEPGAAEAPAKATGTPYAMVLDAKVTLTPATGPEVAIDAWTRVGYRFERSETAATIGLDTLGLVIRQNGLPIQDSSMSREAFKARPGPGAAVIEIPYDKAPPQLQEMLGAFGSTIATVALDPADGRETGRDFKVKGPLANTFSGLVDSILSVHAAMPEEGDRWEAPARLALAQGQSATGTLAFEKVKPVEGKLVTVKVSGTLKAEGAIGQAKVRQGKYRVSGEQVYDAEAGAWRSARWTVDMDYILTDLDDKPTGKAVGPLTLIVGAPDDLPSSPPAADESPKP